MNKRGVIFLFLIALCYFGLYACKKNPTGPGTSYCIDSAQCLACNRCLEVCPHNAITVKNGKPYISQTLCKNCGLCAANCPVNAIR